MPQIDCTHNIDPLKLVREGLSQAQRQLAALAPEFAPVDQHGPAHRMIFARAYSAYLRFFDEKNLDGGDWQPFFSSDVSVQLAVASVQDVDFYKANIKANFDFLNKLDNDADLAGLRLNLGQLFGSAATLAAQLDQLALGLPAELPLQAQLQNLIRRQLAPALKSLLLYHRDGLLAASPPPAGPYLTEAAPSFDILGAAYTLPQALQSADRPLSRDWIADDAATTWPQYLANLANLLLYPDTGIYGSGTTLFARVNHIATHNLFTSIFERLLKVYARAVGAAAEALEASFTARDSHEPHYGLFLAFLRLYERVRAESNTLTARHLDFYYREVLRLREKGAQPAHVHLLGELAKAVPDHLMAEGAPLKAGKDAKGKDAFFALSRDTVLNQASVAAMQTVYRHDAEPVAGGGHDAGRLYASPVANSLDGLGAPLSPELPSWHPFHNKIFTDGALAQIRMPTATLGFAVASHYLLLAEGERSIDLRLTLAGPGPAGDLAADALCLLSTAAGWLEKAPDSWQMEAGVLQLSLHLGGADPAIVAYQEKVHGARFGVQLPVLQVLLRQRPDADYPYARLQDIVLLQCQLAVDVSGVKALSVSNDFGPVDTSKPFQPFGALPAVNSKLVIGAREVFQKKLDSATVQIDWQSKAVVYPSSLAPTASVDYLVAGQWQPALMSGISIDVDSLPLTAGLNLTVREAPDLSPPEFYGNDSRQGYLRLRLDADLGQATYQTALIDFLHGITTTQPTPQPVAPVMAALTMDYKASQTIALDSADSAAFENRQARFFHLAPFGQAEQHPLLNGARKVWLLPQFVFHRADSGVESGGEFYIGVAGLKPPQNLALLMEVVAGTADPQTPKPPQHVLWSYLRRNEWIAFAGNQVGDGTAGLLASGIVTLSVPADANADSTLLAPGMHWIRVAVATRVDAVCRLLMVAAQAMEAQFADQGNDPAFAATVLPAGSVTKLAAPDAAVKQLSQPFASFGGRGAEAPGDFHTRVSERLRHKDRAIALWDYEHLVLEAFPQIYKVKCLNHTQYEPAPGPGGIYRELAPGHVTIVTVPNQQFQNLRDPLRPFTSLDLLRQVETFLRQRAGCFVQLHVRNPKFEEVRLDFKVRLRDDFDETFYVKQLREEITRFLSPWAFPGGAAPSFGGKVYKSVLINFVEERPYVDYVSDFKLFHDTDTGPGTVDLAMVSGSLAVSILVSVPAARHAIEVLHPLAQAGAAEHCPCEAS